MANAFIFVNVSPYNANPLLKGITMNATEMLNELNDMLSDHPLACPECGGWKHADEMICEDCQIAIVVENTSII